MKITGFRTLKTVHNWKRPIGDVNGCIKTGITEIPILILETNEGINGIGIGDVKHIEQLFDAISGEDPRGVSALYDQLLNYTFKAGHQGSIFASIGTIDMALWDLKAKISQQPLWQLLGAKCPFVPGYASGLDFPLTLEELFNLHQKFVERGFTAFKLKGGECAKDDIERINLLIDLYRKNTKNPQVMIDVNESMNKKQSIRYVQHIQETIDLVWIEEPVRRWDIDGNKAICSSISCGLATGENLTGIEQFSQLFKHNAVDIVQTGMCWGISHFMRVAYAAHMFNLPISPVGYNTNPVAHAAAAVPNHLITEVQDIEFPIGLNVDQNIVQGGIELGRKFGLGIEIDEKVINQLNDNHPWDKFSGPHVRKERKGLNLSS